MIRVHFPASIPGRPEMDLVRALRQGEKAYVESYWSRRFKRLLIHAREHFRAVEVDDAQVFFYPHDDYFPTPATQLAADEAQRRGMKCLFFRTSDHTQPVEVPRGGILYRHSIFRRERVEREFAKPAFAEDFLADSGGEVEIRAKEPTPSVGFCGFVSNPLMRGIYRAMRRKRKAEGLALRARLLSLLEGTQGVNCNFIRNNQFMMGKHGIWAGDADRAAQVRQRFLDNVLQNDYTLCVRGAGNFSYRFYEVLAVGRIPVFVNTDCVMPFEDEIDWRKHCVWIEAEEMDQIGRKVLQFHQSLSDNDFQQLQQRNRRLWEEYLEPLTFYRRALSAALPK